MPDSFRPNRKGILEVAKGAPMQALLLRSASAIAAAATAMNGEPHAADVRVGKRRAEARAMTVPPGGPSFWAETIGRPVGPALAGETAFVQPKPRGRKTALRKKKSKRSQGDIALGGAISAGRV